MQTKFTAPARAAKATIVQEYLDGAAPGALAKRYSVSASTIVRMLTEAAATRLPVHYPGGRYLLPPIEHRDSIVSRYRAGDSLKAIGRDVWPNLARHNWNNRVRAYLHYVGETRRRNCDPRYFDCIDSEAKAYWIGFLAADGSVCRPNLRSATWTIRIELTYGDRDHLHAFQSAIGCRGPLSIINRGARIFRSGRMYRPSQTASVQITCRELGEALIRHGVVPRKSWGMSFPTTVPDDLMRHYIRGYLDGDGHIGRGKSRHWSVQFSGTHEFLDQLRLVINQSVNRHDAGHIHLDKRHRGKSGILPYSGNLIAPTIARWLYEGAAIYLGRKQAMYRNLVEHISQHPPRIQRILTDTETAAIASAYAQGIGVAVIAERHNLSRTGVLNVARRSRLPMRRKRIALTGEERTDIVRRLTRGEPPNSVARDVGVGKTTVRRVLETLRHG